MPDITTVSSLDRYQPFSGAETPLPSQAHHPAPENPLAAPQRHAQQEKLPVRPNEHCGKPVEVSVSGRSLHRKQGTRPCMRCVESRRLRDLYSKLMNGGGVVVHIGDLVAFAREWESLTDDLDRPEEAARVMILGMSVL
jgi:hypothetical protein